MTGSFSTADAVFAGIILFFGVRSLVRGFVREAGTIAGIAGGIVLGRLLYPRLAPAISPRVGSDLLARALAFALIFAAVYLAGALASLLLQRFVRKTLGGIPDRVAGFLFGSLKGAILVGVFVVLVRGFAGGIESSFLRNSALSPLILTLMDFLAGLVPGLSARA
ncbi:MAG: CvpA family protein [bacterium]